MATIEVTKDVEELLAAARKENPAQSDAEILKRALSELRHQRELERRREWAESLPILELSDEERTELTEALREADREPGEALTLEALKKELKAAACE
jgi:hypothetical protein